MSESEKLKLITDFVESIKNEKNSNDDIIRKFLPIDTAKKALELERLLLNAVREELNKGDIELKYVSYAKAEPEKTKSFNVSNLDLENLFFILNKGSVFIPVLISDKKIISFSSINKSGRRFLVLLK